MSEIYNFILRLRAIRDYRPEPLSDEDLEAILEAGRWTGSSKNRQDWSFVAVTDPERLQELAEHGHFTQPIRDSAAAIVLVSERGGTMFDIGRAAQNMMLAAEAIGVASCPITFHREKGARRLVDAPMGSQARYGIALGYPAPNARPRKMGGRKPAEAVIRLDRR